MKKDIKLLFVTHLFPPAIGGVEIHIKHLSAILVKRGYRVKVLTTNAYSTEAFFLGDKRRIDIPHETIDGVEVERLGFKTYGSRILRRLCILACRIKYPFNNRIRMLSFGPRNRKFIKRITAHDADVIYAAPLPTLNVYYAYKAAKRMKKPLIIIPSYHIFDPCSFYNKIFFKMMREADIVMAQSPMERDYLAKEGNINKNKIIILPPFPLKEHQPIPMDENNKKFLQGGPGGAVFSKSVPPGRRRQETRERYGIKEKFIVLYLGQHGIHKKVNVVLEAMEYVWQHAAMKEAALVIAGGITDNTKKLKQQAAALEETGKGKVYFIDNFPTEEKEDIFQMSDIFISLSEMESFGIVFVEAMNNGLPVIASKNCVARYIIDESQNGVLVEPQCLTEVAGAIIELLSDEAMRQKFSENARKRAIEKYHPQHIIDTWEEVIANVIANP
ncbi:MAG: glycosyltransferase family 4 protein [Candidatus Aminicenantes bacterium]|jgi:glycosyltransferase involved in cell wall biosynthesis